MAQNPFKVPQQMRDLAERNIEQVRVAYDQFMGAMNQAMGMWAQSIPGRRCKMGQGCLRCATQMQLSR